MSESNQSDQNAVSKVHNVEGLSNLVPITAKATNSSDIDVVEVESNSSVSANNGSFTIVKGKQKKEKRGKKDKNNERAAECSPLKSREIKDNVEGKRADSEARKSILTKDEAVPVAEVPLISIDAQSNTPSAGSFKYNIGKLDFNDTSEDLGELQNTSSHPSIEISEVIDSISDTRDKNVEFVVPDYSDYTDLQAVFENNISDYHEMMDAQKTSKETAVIAYKPNLASNYVDSKQICLTNFNYAALL